ncbi:hypothetical protein [Burkholderia gladioli]|uniref:hypothetical protein n=1 Tax=Burkholderia gladioli TaxID=28095 RepID=UPI00163E42A8|nr:hypothetical protein [Burkholderia gladioli]
MVDVRSIVTVEKEIDGGCHTAGLKVAGGQPIIAAIQQAWYQLDIALDALWPLSEDDAKVYGAIVPAATARALLQSAEEAIANAVRPEEQAQFRAQLQAEEKNNG